MLIIINQTPFTLMANRVDVPANSQSLLCWGNNYILHIHSDIGSAIVNIIKGKIIPVATWGKMKVDDTSDKDEWSLTVSIAK